MKKIFSLLTALFMILSVSAMQAPQKKGIQKRHHPAIEKVEAQHKVLGAKKVADKKFVRRALKDVFDVNIATVGSQFYEEDSDIYYVMLSEDGEYSFSFDIVVDADAQDVVLGQTYTLDDMLSAYTGGYNNESSLGTATAATFTKTLNEEGKDVITASMTFDSGDTYNLSYVDRFELTGDTTHLIFTEPVSTMSYYSYSGDWYVKSANDNFEAALDFFSDDNLSPVGTYESSDFDFNYTYVIPNAGDEDAERVYAREANGVVTATEDGRINFNFYLVGNDGVVYEVVMFYEVPEAEAFETITSDNLDVEQYSFWGYVYYSISASDANNTISLLSWEDDIVGTFEISDDFSGSITNAEGVSSSIYSGSVTIELTEDGGYHVTGTVLCENNIEYTLDLIFVMPEPTRTATFSAEVNYGDYTSYGSDGWLQMYGYNDDETVYATVCVNTGVVEGTYTISDIDKSYTYVVELGADTAYFSVLNANIVVTVADNGDVSMTGTLLLRNDDDANDVVEYTITMTYTKPVPTNFGTIDAEAEYVEGSVSYYSVWQVASETDNQVVYITAYLSDSFEGSYGINDLLTNYSFVANINEADTTYYIAVDAELEATVADDNTFTLTGTLTVQNINDETDIIQYTVNLHGELPKGLAYDSEEPFDAVFETFTYDTDYVDYGYLYVEAQNDDNAAVVLEFIVAENQTELLDGVYNIDNSGDVNTVTASIGVADGYLTYSLAGYVDDEGYYTDVWFLVSGTVTVSNGVITIDALNSYDQQVTIVIGAVPETAAKTVNATDNKAKKVLRNGMLIIRANDTEYNVSGAQLRK